MYGGGAYQSVYVKVRGQFSPTMWVLRTKVMSSYMVTCTFTHWPISPSSSQLKKKKVSWKTSLSLKPVSTCKCSCAFVPVEFWDWRSRTFLLQEWRRPWCGIPDQQGISSRSSPSTPCPLQKLCHRIKLRSEGRALFPTTRRVSVHPCCACWGACTDCSSS